MGEDTRGLTMETLVVGPLMVNCYLLTADRAGTLIVDPGGDEEIILAHLEARGMKPVGILNTHSHFDHVGANGALTRAFGAPVMIHRDEAEWLTEAHQAAANFGVRQEPSPPPDRLLQDGDEIELGEFSLKVLHTPGHSPGGVSLQTPVGVITGDALFAGAIGRTDLRGGDGDLLLASIREKLFTLEDDLEVFPGHGPSTTIGDEKRTNPFLSHLLR